MDGLPLHNGDTLDAPDLPQILTSRANADSRFADTSFETFSASQLAFCPRQTYLAHLSLRSNAGWRGQFKSRRLIQEYLKHALDENTSLTVEPQISCSQGNVRLLGRPTCYDPSASVVYHLKPRNGWYKFNPPVRRHVDQIQLYMHGLDADAGQLLYVSMADVTDMQVWPADFTSDDYVQPDPGRVGRLFETAEVIRAEIVENGIACETDEIPFAQCGCYLCETEDLELPAAAEELTGVVDRSSDHLPDQEFMETPSPLDIGTTGQVLGSDKRHVPHDLRQFEYWVVWDTENKRALAPWQTGNMYPAEWADHRDVNPRRKFEKANMVAELPIKQIHETWPFPDGDPDRVSPAVLLPHAEGRREPSLVFVDIDNVRDPETGEISSEAVALVRRLDGYTELSTSGRGLHVWVRGNVPELPFTAPLDQTGRLEIYDRSRFTAGTWLHVEDTPLDEVPVAQDSLRAIVDRYG